ncbi:MAG: 3-keto-5-aminohexanoate cleavage protein [Solirubrobacteraceae bacterium]|nr:3-keto-5-aminohexanoate cleavage protein [Solirubrobacteraceae bacterium]
MPPTPLIINLAPTGMVPTKADTPHVPTCAAEVAEDVAACRELGVAIVHLHARDGDGRPSHRADDVAPLVAAVRDVDPELIVCVTCSGRLVSSVDDRAEALELDGALRPEMASLTLGSNNFASAPSINPPDVIRELASRMRERGIKPELEAFEPGMVAFGRRLVDEGLLDEPCYVNVLLGNLGTAPLQPHALAFRAEIPDRWTWALAGLGRFQLDASALAIALGGHVRIGLEDNIWFDRARTVPATNAALVRRIHELAELLERPVATPAQARAQLGLVTDRR